MASERLFEAAELRRFLTAVDSHLTSPATIVILGGSAIALYGVAAGTMDIDLWGGIAEPVQQALQRARVETGLQIPVAPAAVADIPFHAEDRLRAEPSDWKRLRVLKLEPHDLALSKAMRANEHDLKAIEQLHLVAPLDRDTLMERYLDEMTHVIGPRARLDLNFVSLIERLYGEAEAERAEEQIRTRRRYRNQPPRR